ncbi:MAG: GNAT family N-acetyltransferase [Chloroflexi bacterium]|nr:GNAT family N-acetyltransferase [Chloroflexota bacterium]
MLGAEQVSQVQMQVSVSVTIRLACEADLPGLEWDEETRQLRRVFQATYEDMLAGKRTMFVAAVNQQPVGRLFLQHTSRVAQFADGHSRAYLYSVHVMTPFQRRGIGSQMMKTAELFLCANQFRWATLCVSKDNHDAQRLYERLGYRVFDSAPGRWRYIDHRGRVRHVNEPSWVMIKLLTGVSKP